jgi:hypothetical protein
MLYPYLRRKEVGEKHKYLASHAAGLAGERDMDVHFGPRFAIANADEFEQKELKFDRRLTNKSNGLICRVEYKTDNVAAETGNAFIETLSNDVVGSDGWAYCSHADILVHYIPAKLEIRIMRMYDIKKSLPKWEHKYPYRLVPNYWENGEYAYSSGGILVPLNVIDKMARLEKFSVVRA